MGQHIVKQPNGKYAIFSSIVDHFIAYDATPEEIRNHFRAIAEEESDRHTERGIKRADGPFAREGLTEDLARVRLIHGDAEANEWAMILKSPPCLHGRHSPTIVHRTGGTSAALRNRCGICGLLLIRQSGDGPWIALSEADEDALMSGKECESHSAAGKDKA